MFLPEVTNIRSPTTFAPVVRPTSCWIEPRYSTFGDITASGSGAAAAGAARPSIAKRARGSNPTRLPGSSGMSRYPTGRPWFPWPMPSARPANRSWNRHRSRGSHLLAVPQGQAGPRPQETRGPAEEGRAVGPEEGQAEGEEGAAYRNDGAWAGDRGVFGDRYPDSSRSLVIWSYRAPVTFAGVLTIGLWLISPYAGLCLASVLLRKRLAAVTVLLGTAVLAGLGVLAACMMPYGSRNLAPKSTPWGSS